MYAVGTGPVKPPTTLVRVKRFLRAAVAVVKDRKFVSREEHARRMAICAECPLRSLEGLGCHGCIDDLRAVEKHVGKMPDGGVLVCSACGCVCWVKAWGENATWDAAETGESISYAPGCWRRPV